MEKVRVMSIFGTRPEAIKMCPLVKKINESQKLESIVCLTGQHRQMLDQVINLYNIKIDEDLNLMRPNQNLENLTCDIINGVSDCIKKYSPNLVLVHGDTTTAFASALSAFYNQVEIGHVEAGLRTGDMRSPWPEEGNRHLISVLTKHHFVPTEQARKNLLNENKCKENIIVTGNTVIDSLLETRSLLNENKLLKDKINKEFPFINEYTKIILVTGHRRENLNFGFDGILDALIQISKLHKDTCIIYPVHLNPKVRDKVYGKLSHYSNIYLLPPQDYLPFVFLMMAADIILTDSGGIQEEAPSLNKPVLVMRNTTERPEALELGAIKLVGTNSDVICQNVERLLSNIDLGVQMPSIANPYGDGTASLKIVNYLEKL